MNHVRITIIAGLLAVAAWACGSSDGGGTTAATADPDVGQTAKATLTASAGGSLQTPSGGAKLDVPAGALKADTELTVTVAAAAADTATAIYDFGPDGTQFTKKVALAIKYDGTPGSGKKAVLAWQNNGKWTEVANSTVADGKVSGEIEHFTKYTIVVVDDQVVVTSSCGDVATNFQACGGDIGGAWSIKDVCFSEAIISDHPDANCNAASAVVDIQWHGTVTLDGTTLTRTAISGDIHVDLTAPLTCADFTDCAGVKDLLDMPATCAVDGTNCKCTVTGTKQMDQGGSDSYVLQDNAIVTTSKDGSKNSTPYCLASGQVVVKVTTGASSGPQYFYLVLGQ